MRLDKYLAERTGMTRSESRKAITKGRIMVDGAVVRKADAAVPETAALAVDALNKSGLRQQRHYLLYIFQRDLLPCGDLLHRRIAALRPLRKVEHNAQRVSAAC